MSGEAEYARLEAGDAGDAPFASETAPEVKVDISARANMGVADLYKTVTNGTQIRFSNLSYDVGPKRILHNVTGRMGPAKLIAVMGASGAGKTTLLNILAGLVHDKGISGQVLLNGEPVDSRVLRKVSAYVMQDDVLLPNLTPREALWDVARMRLPESYDPRAKAKKVDRVLELLGLTRAADVITGHPEGEKGLSGGQRKRLSIALEVFTEPRLMFLDEPTSGLDAATAYSCVLSLRNLVRTGKTVVCTIHQPSSKIFNLFDEVMLLSKGQILFHGATKSVIPFFAQLGLQCPMFYNPADFLIDTVSEQPTETNKKMIAAYLSAQAEEDRQAMYQLTPVAYPPTRYPTGHLLMFKVLLERALRNIRRDAIVTRFRVASHIMLGLITGLIFYNLGYGPRDIADRLSLMFFALIFLLLNSVIPTVMTFPLERAVFEKEHRNNWYAVRPYFLAKTVSDIPFQLVLPTAYISIMYYLANLRPGAGNFLEFVLTGVLTTLCGQSLGILVSILAPSLTVAMFAAPISLMPQLLFCGFLANVRQLPRVLKWLQWLSFVRYGYENMLISQFKDKTWKMGNGNDLIETTGFDKDEFARNTFVLAGYALFLRAVSYVALRYRVKGKVLC